MQLNTDVLLPKVIHATAVAEHRYIDRIATAALQLPPIDATNVRDILAKLAFDVRGVQASHDAFEGAFVQRTRELKPLTDAYYAGRSASNVASKISLLNAGASMIGRLPVEERAAALQKLVVDAHGAVPTFITSLVATRDAYAAVIALPHETA